MENASKALLIAGTMLVAVIVIAIIIGLITTLKKATDGYGTKLDTIELQKYNSIFEVYIDRNDITAQEILSLVNISQQKDKQTKVYVDSVNCTENWNENRKTEFLQSHVLTEYEYKSIGYDLNAKVVEIKFKTK